MALLPKQLPLSQMQSVWKSQLDPLLANPLNSTSVLKDIPLASGANVINHKLGAPLQGWFIVRMKDAYAQIYDTQNSNLTPQLTLNLHASAPTIVDIGVF